MILGLVGCGLVQRGIKWGWLLYASASAINVYIGINAGLLGVAVAGLIYCCMELKGYIHHRNKGH